MECRKADDEEYFILKKVYLRSYSLFTLGFVVVVVVVVDVVVEVVEEFVVEVGDIEDEVLVEAEVEFRFRDCSSGSKVVISVSKVCASEVLGIVV